MSGLEEDLIDRIMGLLGTPTAVEGTLTEQDVDAMKRIAGVLDAGFPLVALLQLVRVYAQSIRKIAEAEVRLFHLFVHEPLIAEGVDALQMAEEMEGLARDLFPSAAPLMSYIHNRYLRFYTEQDVVGHMETELDGSRQLGPGARWRSASSTSPGSPASPRRRATRRHSTWSSASSTPSRRRCPPRRSSSRRSATR